MANKFRISFLSCFIITLVITLASLVLRTYNMLTGFDISTGNFDATAARTAWLVLIMVTVILAAVVLILLRRLDGLRVLYDDIPTIFSSAFMIIVLIAYATNAVVSAVNGTHTGVALAFSIISAILGLASAVFFVCIILKSPKAENLRSAFAVVCVVFCCSLAFFLYTENDLFATSPIKILHIASVMASAFFFLGECRIALNRTLWGLYIAVGFLALVLTATDAISCLIYIPAKGTEEIGSSAYAFLIFAFALYIFSRILAIYLLNAKNVKGLLAVFDKSTERLDKSVPETDEEENEPEQLHFEIEKSETSTEENAN